ncbi:MAG: heme-binding protein [Kiritimatiellales bacterium]|nr:heme-binding protein [Kiritimatiellales bacterium]
MKSIAILCLAAVTIPTGGNAYEKAFTQTDTGKIEVKKIPERTLIVAEKDGDYFKEDNALFRRLFRYIQDNDVSMTVPVKAEVSPGKMYFYVGTKDIAKELKDTDAVKVVVEPERSVLSIGVRGGYSEKNFKEARDKLLDWLAASKQWKKSGDAYAIYWNGPFTPFFMKRFEVHIPVEAKPGKAEVSDS